MSNAYITARDARKVYANFMMVETGIYDVTLLLGEHPLTSTWGVEVEAVKQPPVIHTIVKINPLLAKVLHLILTKHLEIHQQKVGVMNIPKSILHDLGLEELI